MASLASEVDAVDDWLTGNVCADEVMRMGGKDCGYALLALHYFVSLRVHMCTVHTGRRLIPLGLYCQCNYDQR